MLKPSLVQIINSKIVVIWEVFFLLFCFLCFQLLSRSASVRGFLLFHFLEEFRPTFAKLVDLYDSGKLKCNVDFGHASPTGVFKGLDSIADAVEVRIKSVRVALFSW